MEVLQQMMLQLQQSLQEKIEGTTKNLREKLEGKLTVVAETPVEPPRTGKRR